MNWKSLQEQIILVILVAAGLYSGTSLASDWISNLFAANEYNAASALQLGLEPAWYESTEWWWESARKVAVFIGFAAFCYAIFIGPWQDGALMFFLMVASFINSRNVQQTHVTVQYERDAGLDVAFVLIIVAAIVSGAFT